jgi:hypothetical protein
MIAWNEDGKITSFKVMIRPFKGGPQWLASR